MSTVTIPSAPPIASAPTRSNGACAVVLPDRDVIVPPSAHTLAGFRAWAKSDAFPERGRFSFLDNEIFVDLSMEELETHAKLKGEITYAIVGWNKKQQLGQFYPDGALVTNEEANLSSEPDATFVCYETLESGRAKLVPRVGTEGQYLEIEGSPDWVLEIVSESSVRKDTVRLRELYHRAGVREYWLIDARGEELSFQILIRQEAGFVEAEAGRGGWQTSVVFGRRFRLRRERRRLDLWEYTLDSKAGR